jgi:hypothetical protein
MTVSSISLDREIAPRAHTIVSGTHCSSRFLSLTEDSHELRELLSNIKFSELILYLYKIEC